MTLDQIHRIEAEIILRTRQILEGSPFMAHQLVAFDPELMEMRAKATAARKALGLPYGK